MFSIIRLSRSFSGHLVPRRRHGLLTVFGSPLWPVIRNPELPEVKGESFKMSERVLRSMIAGTLFATAVVNYDEL